MRLIISVLAILTTFSSIPAFAQLKKWMDEKGVVHYEAIGPGPPQTSNADQPKPNARRPLDSAAGNSYSSRLPKNMGHLGDERTADWNDGAGFASAQKQLPILIIRA